MTQTITRQKIKELVTDLDLLPMIERGFVAYSSGHSVVPPVGELQLDKGEVHIKYGFIKEQPYYVIKIASGFYGNNELNLPSSNGCMLVFCQNTGQLRAVLLDEGYLTDVRTAVAGAVAAKYLAPTEVNRIGIVGTGIQAEKQLEWLSKVVDCRNVLVWGRSRENAEKFVAGVRGEAFAREHGFQIELASDTRQLQRMCNLIVTTTPATEPLLSIEDLQPGTHITAVGSDTPDKQELDCNILAQADVVVADSRSQCQIRGEISQALRAGKLNADSIVELGSVISGDEVGRSNDQQITVADLTGVAVQDIQIASAVIECSNREP